MGGPRICLASASPRRAELLAQIGVAFDVRPVTVNESPLRGEAAPGYVLRLAEEKARAAWSALDEPDRCPVLAADTTVELDGEIFGKPLGQGSAQAMLRRLSGCTSVTSSRLPLPHATAKPVASTSRIVQNRSPSFTTWPLILSSSTNEIPSKRSAASCLGSEN